MAIKLRALDVEVDVRAELEQYDWSRARWSSEKLIAASPFRYDHSPSFFVYLDAGTWGDSGAIDEEFSRGNFVRLLSFLRGEDEDSTTEYLLETYSVDYGAEIKLITPQLTVRQQRKPLSESLLEPYQFRHPYLTNRGITESVQRLMGVGYSKPAQAVAIPWRMPDGRLATVKYRQVHSKTFWYEKGGAPLKNLIYGIDVVYRRNCKSVVICEAEIDAMSIMSAGFSAVAVGGANLTDQQRDLITRSPIDRLLVATDNDKAGERLKRQIIEKLSGVCDVKIVDYPRHYKDINEAHTKEDISKFVLSSKQSRNLSTGFCKI